MIRDRNWILDELGNPKPVTDLASWVAWWVANEGNFGACPGMARRGQAGRGLARQGYITANSSNEGFAEALLTPSRNLA